MLHSNRSYCQKLCGNYWTNVVYNNTYTSPIWQDTLLSSQILSNIEEIKKKETCWGAQAIFFFFFWKNTILGNFFLKAYCLQHKFAFLKMENFDQLFHFCRFWALEGREVYLFIFLDNFPLFYFCLNDYFGCWEKRWVIKILKQGPWTLF